MNPLLNKEREEFEKEFSNYMLMGNILDWLTAHDKRILEGVKEVIYKKMDEYEYHKDQIHCTCLAALREKLETNLLQAGE